MRRFFLVCFVISLGSGCLVQEGDPPDGDDVQGGPDAGGDTTPGPDGGSDVACEPAATQLPFGNHNAGAACLSCHTGTGAAPKWTIAGTIYGGDGLALPGATITVTDNGGNELKLISASNGNFYTSQTVQFPVRVVASRCPDTRPMLNAQQIGNCNSCHSGASRIKLP
jgi:hypothetical protein